MSVVLRTVATSPADKTLNQESRSMNETAVNESFERSPALPSFQQTYHEISDRHVSESDVLAQLHANIAQLEDLHGRLRFMMREVTYLLKRS